MIVPPQIIMTAELKVHPTFFREFATKTWVSPNEIVKELIENAFDEDATKVLVTILNERSIIIEDDAGMDQNGIEKFLLLGSPHKREESISPGLKRIRTGRYGTGRLSFLTSFENMRIKTKRGDYIKSFVIDSTAIDKLFSGNAKLEALNIPALKRNGTELVLGDTKVTLDTFRLSKEIRKLAILRQPFFEVYIKNSTSFTEWDFSDAQPITAPDIQGHRIPVDLDDGKIIGEIVIARRPLSEDEKGIAVLVGNHVVVRSTFDFAKINRITGYVRCDSLTSRFADKSALIEDQEYTKFNQIMKAFIVDTVFPTLTEYEDVLITREESKIYREIDKVLGQAIIENLETQEEEEGYDMVDVKEIVNTEDVDSSIQEPRSEGILSENSSTISPSGFKFGSVVQQSAPLDNNDRALETDQISPVPPMTQGKARSEYSSDEDQHTRLEAEGNAGLVEVTGELTERDRFQAITQEQLQRKIIVTRKIRRPVVTRTFALKKVGYKVIPYEDDSDSRYSFTSENVVFVNKANSTYCAEAARGDEFLLRHIISIVAEVLAEARHPEGKDALELQNRLVAEAIRIHDRAVTRK
jgi:Histidine kinase-, DNA gyrase B-, and HSP90-like ATPase